ncbi:MBL fold metallo-hydrolase [Cellulomonas palmilytica]|uniref:MBL fold metallo-hydrolase n=1 Tax=Cellulomonas palmilytica TaxID=2608402 RepID=UPI001F15CC81|nr:MBL fold metallo-hydrolase [Cellulomonas palmilytica]UJP39283.1 MBL fold metallo-hydrolase [Cellulomonas palmilytica]
MLVATSAVYATTTSVLVGSGGACLVVDPGVTADEVAALGAAVSAHAWRTVAVWSTHPHWDHRLDGPAFAGVPRWAVGRDDEHSGDEAAALAAARDADDELARVLRSRPGDAPAQLAPTPSPAPFLPAPPDAPPGWRALDTAAIGWAGPRVLVLAHRAHAPGHGALLLPDAGVLVAGDMLSDVEVPLLDEDAEDPLGDYAAALDALAASGADLVVPGHGSPGPLDARVAADRAYVAGLTEPAPTCSPDPRLSSSWQRDVDARQRRLVRP